MRNLLLLVLGFLLGVSVASIVAAAMNRRDAYARGTMQVMQHHFGLLRERLRAGTCTAADLVQARTMLSAMAEEIGSAVYPGAKPDRPFEEFTQRLHAAIAELPAAPSDCRNVAPALSRIGNACDACHQQYR